MKKAFVIIPLFIISCLIADGQHVIGVVDYMKIDNPEEYLSIEKEWKKIQEEQLKQGLIVGWAIYQVMYKTIDDPYNYIVVNWYDSFSKMNHKIPENIIEAVFPNMSKGDWKKFVEQREKSGTLVSSVVFHQRLTSANKLDRKGNIYIINELSVKRRDSKEYIKLCEEIYKPLYEEDIQNKNRTLWSLWEKWPSDQNTFLYLSADGYARPDQIEPGEFIKYFNKIHPDKDVNQISKRMEELRMLVNSEMWKMIYRIN